MLHTDIPTPTSIRQLAAVREPFCVSIYLPTSPVPTESEPSRIELRNQVTTAARQLTEAGAGRAAAPVWTAIFRCRMRSGPSERGQWLISTDSLVG